MIDVCLDLCVFEAFRDVRIQDTQMMQAGKKGRTGIGKNGPRKEEEEGQKRGCHDDQRRVRLCISFCRLSVHFPG